MNIQLKTGKQKGFTIIELVVVILLLGILAATALPRFLDVTEEAHDAVVDGTASALQTGMALYRAQWIAQQQPAAGSVLSATEFNGLRIAPSGYPIGINNVTAGGAFSAVSTEAHTQCAEIYNGMLQTGRVPVTASDEDDDGTVGADDLATTDQAPNDTPITEGFVAKRVTGLTTIGGLPANSLVAGDAVCVYVYVADAARRALSTDVPAIVYLPNGSDGTAVKYEAGTVIQTVL